MAAVGERFTDFLVRAMGLYVSVYPTQDRMIIFEGLFLKVPLFHATAIHCHYGLDIEDALFFVH